MPPADTPAPSPRQWPFVVAAVVGVGLIAAPATFRMFDRAPKGAVMIDEFRPFMTEQRITGFGSSLATIDAGLADAELWLEPHLATIPAPEDGTAPATGSYEQLRDEWPAIQTDMVDMLDTIEANIDRFEAVDALPDFALFPWFFVGPGVVVLAVSVVGTVRARRGLPTRGAGIALVVLGVAIVAAPAVFQMFTRAPEGGAMIDDFRPLMTESRVREIQGYFLVIGTGEGVIRTRLVPPVSEATGDDPPVDLTRFLEDWPGISNDMAPMIGAMSDNLDNYAAVAALPPFPLFPWFFVIPGVALAALGVFGIRTTPTRQESTS